MARATVSEPAERTLDAWLTWLLEGQILIQDLPLCVAAWFHAGEAAGRASRDLEVQQLERELNRWYYLATTTPAQRRDDIEQRLATALDQATSEQWAQLDKDLINMAGQHKDSEMAEPVSADTESTHGNKAVSGPQSGVHNPQTIHRSNLAA